MKKFFVTILLISNAYLFGQTITVTSPNGGEYFQKNKSYNITWTSSGVAGNVTIECSTDNGVTWPITVTSTVAAATGTYSWDFSSAGVSSQCLIRITDPASLVSDVSDAVFSVVSLALTSPNGGERYQQGQSYDITWTSSGISGNLTVECYDGSSWISIGTPLASAGLYQYNFSAITPSTNCKVRITDLTSSATDVSDLVFSLVSLAVTSPNGNEHWQVGKQQNITWTQSGLSNVKLEYTTDNGTNWMTIVSSISAALGTYQWTIPNLTSTGCKIRVSDVTSNLIYDNSNSTFTIANLSLTSPNGGENFLEGSSHSITWTSTNVSNVKIDYSTDGGSNYYAVVASTSASTGSYTWTVPAGTSASNCLIKISDVSYSAITDESDLAFSISDLDLTSPTVGLVWQGETVHNITWTSTNISNVKIDYTTNNGTTWIAVVSSTPAAAGAYSWTVPNTPAINLCKVRISDYSYQSNYVTSSLFTIEPVPAIVVTSPNGNENWQEGSVHDITWTATYNISNVDIELTTNNGTNWSTIASSIVASLGTYSWTIPTIYSQNCKIRISNSANSTVNDLSNNTFTISSLVLTSPNGSERWQVGKNYNITWTSTNISNIKLEYSTNNGTGWNTIVSSVSATPASYSWTIPNTVSTNCLVRISDVSNSDITDQSSATFSIVSVVLTSPNGGESWIEGSTHAITWSSSNITNVRLEYSTDGTAWTSIVASTAAATGTYNWTIPSVSASTYRVRVSDASDATINDMTDNQFTISQIDLTSPITSVSWKVGTSHNITWSVSSTISNVKLEYTTNNGSSWNTIASSLVATLGTYEWVVPNTTSAYCKVRISNVSSSSVYAESPVFFTITKSLIVKSPNGGEAWEVGSIKNIIWERDASIDFIRIQYTTNPAANVWTDINTYVDASLGTYSWTVPNAISTNCLMRISDVDNVTNIDSSDAKFTIQSTPSITITRPNGGESFETGADESITWTSNNVTTVKIEYSVDNGAKWNLIRSSLASTGSYTWSVPNINSSQCKIRITDETNSNVFDLSDNTFTIIPRIVVTNPNGGESYYVGSTTNITWTSTNVTTVNIEYSTDNGTEWTIIGSTGAAAGTYSWANIPNAPSSYCLIRVSDSDSPGISDVSNTVFSIVNKIKLLSPNNGESWQVGSTHKIEWQSTSVTNITLTYSTNNGVSWTTIGTATASTGYYNWAIPASLQTSDQYKIRASDASNSSVFDISDFYFTVSSLDLTSPAGSEEYSIGTTQTIKWTSSYISNVNLEYSIDNGLNWIVIEDSVTSTGSYYWQVPNTPSTQCKLRISNSKNSTTSDVCSTTFSIIETPTITVTSPNGGETWIIGAVDTIKWTSNSVINVKLEYSINSGSSWTTITASTISDGSYAWTIPNASSTMAKIRITDTARSGVNDVSDAVFAISSPPKLDLTSPNGGENYAITSTQTIKWTSTLVGKVKLDYSIDNGLNWITIEDSVTSTGNYYWQIPNTPSTQCKLRISETGNSSNHDVSANTFSIVESPTVTVVYPNGGETFGVGKTEVIKWRSNSITSVKLEYSINSGSSWTTIATSSASTGSYSWIIPNVNSNQCRIRISDASRAAIYDVSDTVFSISSKLQLVSPNGGESWQAGSSHKIEWESANITNVQLAYSTNNGTSWISMTSVSAATGSYTWTVPSYTSNQCKIKVSDASNSTTYDLSDSTFTISSLDLKSPNGGESYTVGATQTVTWTSAQIANIQLEYSIDNGLTWTVITASVPSTGSYSWLIPNTSATQCRVRISEVGNVSTLDASANTFTIVDKPSVTVTYPNGGETLEIGKTEIIKWSNSSSVANIKLEYTTNSGNSWTAITSVSASSGTYSWTVPTVNSTLCKIRITDTSRPTVFDLSDSVFVITSAPKLTLTSPNGNEVWRAGTSQSILWTSTNVDSVKLEYSINNGVSWKLINNAVSSTGQYIWQVPVESSYQCRIKVTSTANKEITDISDNTFTIAVLELLTPVDGETLLSGSPYNITWNAAGIANVKLDYTTDEGNSWVSIVASVGALVGKYSWTLPSDNIQQGRVRVSDVTKSSVYDMNESGFSVKQIIVIAPTEFSAFKVGSTQIIQWKTYKIANIRLEYSTDNGTNWQVISSSVPSTVGYYYWIIPNSPSEFCSVKISDADDVEVYSTNQNYFAIRDGNTGVDGEDTQPITYNLSQNYPNPFNPETIIKYQIPERNFVSLKIYNLLGQEIKTLVSEEKPAGHFEVVFNGANLPSGIYIYAIRAGSYSSVKKLMLVK
jgi:hypothetical protein